jgi:hypothetical protein
MILRVTKATVTGPTHLAVEFTTGARGEIDVSELLRGPVFELLKDPQFFQKVELDSVCGTVVWPNGADFAPEALLELATQEATSSAG